VSHNDFNYIAIETAQGIDLEALGFIGGAISADGAYIVVDKCDSTTAQDIGYTPQNANPAYAVGENFPDMLHEEAKAFVRTAGFRGE